MNIEIDAISWDEEKGVFIVDYTIYDNEGRPIMSEWVEIEHTGSVEDMHYTTIEKLKNILKGKKYGTKIKN